MEFRRVEATLMSPCCLSEQPARGNEVSTLSYIPGSALRGMLAQAYLQLTGQPDGKFKEIFWEDVISFPHLYPEDMRPLPLSAYTCKAAPGFLGDFDPGEDEFETHGVWDRLFEDAQGYAGKQQRRCPREGCAHAPLKPHSGFYDGGNPSKSMSQPTLLITRTAVSHVTQSALEASLRSRQELPAGTRFRGLLAASDAQALQHLEQQLPHPIIAYTGQHRAGRVKILIREWGEPPQADFLNWPKETDWLYFALTLASDTILVDRLLRPVITLTPQGLEDQEQGGFPDDVTVQVEKAFCATRRVSGWHTVGRIFKADDIAMVAGSTFLLKVQPGAKASVEGWMKRVIGSGIGLRRSEGFGQVRFDEPLHLTASDQKGGPL